MKHYQPPSSAGILAWKLKNQSGSVLWLPVKSYFILQQGRATEMFYSFDKRSYRFALSFAIDSC